MTTFDQMLIDPAEFEIVGKLEGIVSCAFGNLSSELAPDEDVRRVMDVEVETASILFGKAGFMEIDVVNAGEGSKGDVGCRIGVDVEIEMGDPSITIVLAFGMPVNTGETDMPFGMDGAFSSGDREVEGGMPIDKETKIRTGIIAADKSLASSTFPVEDRIVVSSGKAKENIIIEAGVDTEGARSCEGLEAEVLGVMVLIEVITADVGPEAPVVFVGDGLVTVCAEEIIAALGDRGADENEVVLFGK